MDTYSINRLAAIEHEQRVKSIPAVPEYDAPNVEIQPGWALALALRLALRFFRVLGSVRVPAPASNEASPLPQTIVCDFGNLDEARQQKS